MGLWKSSIRPLTAVASGLLAALLFPPFPGAMLVWVCLVPLLIACWTVGGKRRGMKGFALGWLGGAVASGVQFSWLSVVSPLGAVLLPVYLGLYWGAFGWFCATWGNPWREDDKPPADRFGIGQSGAWSDVTKSLRISFCTAAVWAGLELLRGWVFTGFGWNGLGVAFHQTPVIAQAADLLGVTGLSMLPVFFQTVLVQTARRLKKSAEDGERRTRMDFLAAAGLVAVVLCYGIVRIATEGRGETTRLKALLVQLNIPQEAARQLWTAEQIHMGYEEETEKALRQLAEQDQQRLKEAMEKSDEGEISLRWPDWVIWPECALTGRILITDEGRWGTWPENIETIRRVREAGEFHLLYGINEMEAEDGEDGQLFMKPRGRVWNSIAAMDPEDNLQTYRKHHLVIFGETIPFVDSIPWLKKIYEQQSGAEYHGSFTPGISFDPLPVETLKGKSLSVIPSVCFEDTVPRLVRRFVRPAPQILVNVTNDGWFKESAAAEQHFANARFRSIELRRPMIRCSNTGVSAALDSTGSPVHPDTGATQILTDKKGSHFTRGSLLVELDIPNSPTLSPYAVIGDAGVAVLALCGLTLGWWRRPRELRA
jgi:apolipoprotein N-acyltransferase